MFIQWKHAPTVMKMIPSYFFCLATKQSGYKLPAPPSYIISIQFWNKFPNHDILVLFTFLVMRDDWQLCLSITLSTTVDSVHYGVLCEIVLSPGVTMNGVYIKAVFGYFLQPNGYVHIACVILFNSLGHTIHLYSISPESVFVRCVIPVFMVCNPNILYSPLQYSNCLLMKLYRIAREVSFIIAKFFFVV